MFRSLKRVSLTDLNVSKLRNQNLMLIDFLFLKFAGVSFQIIFEISAILSTTYLSQTFKIKFNYSKYTNYQLKYKQKCT